MLFCTKDQITFQITYVNVFLIQLQSLSLPLPLSLPPSEPPFNLDLLLLKGINKITQYNVNPLIPQPSLELFNEPLKDNKILSLILLNIKINNIFKRKLLALER